jgi:hypothetical protein
MLLKTNTELKPETMDDFAMEGEVCARFDKTLK